MKVLVYKTILFSFLVCNIKVAVQGNCIEGEPTIGEPQPDLNITVLPSTRISEGTNITIICDADYPRLLHPGNTNIRPLPPVQTRIFIKDDAVKTCWNNTALTCRHIILNVNKTIPRRIICSTSNSGGECRFKILELEFINGATDVTTPNPMENITNQDMTTSNPTETNRKEGGNGTIPIQVIIVSSASLITIVFGGIIYMIYVR